MSHFRFPTLLALLALVQASTALGAQYQLDTRQSELVVRTFIDGVASSIGHDHVIQATRYTGTVHFYPAAPDQSQIVVVIDATSLNAAAPELRKKYGLPPGVDEDDRKTIEEHMKGEDQLAVARFKEIRFESTAIHAKGGNNYEVQGKLTIRGVTQPVTLEVQAEIKDGVFCGSGSLRFRQSRFGYEPFSAMRGALKNKDEVVLHVSLVARPG